MKKNFEIVIVVLSLCISLAGCGKKDKTPKELPLLSAVHEKFVAMVRNDFGYEDISIRETGRTLWVYIPLRERIVDIKASPGVRRMSVDVSDKPVVKHVQAEWIDDHLHLEYDIQSSKTYQKDPGYGSNYSEEYSQAQQEIMQGISRVYFDFAEEVRLAGEDPDDPKDLPGLPKFIMLVIADIEKGIEIESMLYFSDLQKAMSMIPSITGDEFMKRYVADVRGGLNIIDNTDGNHLQYRDIDMKEFLARQIENRVNFKYGHSVTAPSEDTREEILTAISDALQSYQYFAVMGVELKDLFMNTTETLSKSDLMSFIDAHLLKEPTGRLINIKFGL